MSTPIIWIFLILNNSALIKDVNINSEYWSIFWYLIFFDKIEQKFGIFKNFSLIRYIKKLSFAKEVKELSEFPHIIISFSIVFSCFKLKIWFLFGYDISNLISVIFFIDSVNLLFSILSISFLFFVVSIFFFFFFFFFFFYLVVFFVIYFCLILSKMHSV